MGPAYTYWHSYALQKNATVVITDSVVSREETTFLGVPCLTMSENTERPVTVTVGTKPLYPIGRDFVRLKTSISQDPEDGKSKKGNKPPLWDRNKRRTGSRKLLLNELMYFVSC